MRVGNVALAIACSLLGMSCGAPGEGASEESQGDGPASSTLQEPLAELAWTAWVKGDETNFEANNPNGVTQVFKISTGYYRVQFYGMASAFHAEGTAHVVAVGNNNRRCTLTSFEPSADGSHEDLYVRCRRGSDTTYADSRFYAYFSSRPTASQHNSHVAFVYADQASTASYSPEKYFNYNRSGGLNTITRLGTGTYRVDIPHADITRGGGTATVTAVTTGANHCKVLDWYPTGVPESVFVDCYNGSGSKSDTRFTMLFLDGSSLGTYYGAYAWVAGNSDPDPYWTWDANTIGMACLPEAARWPVESFNGHGPYQTGFPGQLRRTGPEIVLTTAVGAGSNYCKVFDYPVKGVGWEPIGMLAQVTCYDTSGVAAESGHNVLIDYTGTGCTQ